MRYEWMGLASKVMHIRPWEWDLMSVEEADYVVEWLREYKREMDEAASK